MPPQPSPAIEWEHSFKHSEKGGGGLLAVIPALNEAGSVGEIVAQVRRILQSPVLVVSDASSDDTGAIARKAGAQVIELAERIGAWGAMQTGIRHALRHGFGAVVTLDADGQHDPACLTEMAAAYRQSHADIIIGTYPQRLSMLKRLAWAWFRAITGLGVDDLTSGLRIYGPRALQILASSEATLLDYQDVGVLLLLRKYGLTVHEVPVTMYPRVDGRSRVFASWLTVVRYMAQTTVLCIARIGRMGSRPAILPSAPRR